MKETKFADNCAIMEQTGDGERVGRCWSPLTNNVCERHGDVTKVQDHYKETGELTLESDFRN